MSWFKRFVERMDCAAMASTLAQAGGLELAREIMKTDASDSPELGRVA